MIELNIQDEVSKLKAVILGIAVENGPTPSIEDAYDPKSREHLLAGTYPTEENMIKELTAFYNVLQKYDVRVYRPKIITNCNQIFTRDIAFVIGNQIVLSNILPDRENELIAIEYIIDKIESSQIVYPDDDVHIEGGDVIVCNDHIFIGTYTGDDYASYITARTNKAAVEFITKTFPSKTVVPFELRKSNTEARDNALHLDCCFQPVGNQYAIIHKEGFLIEEEYQWLKDFFGEENVFEITKEEMYHMNSNIFSISPKVVVSEKNFVRLNEWLRSKGITVEEIPFAEISKQEGLLRCSTLPLIRE